MGHLARQFEEAGIPTVVVACSPFAGRLEKMSLPRLLLTRHPMGRVFGPPGNRARQEAVLLAALDLLESARTNGTVKWMDGNYFEGSG